MIFIGVLGYYGGKYAFGKKITKKIKIILIITVGLAASYYSLILFTYRPKETALEEYLRSNLLGLFLLFLFIQFLRVVLDQADFKARYKKLIFGKEYVIKNLVDMLINFIVYSVIYLLIIYSSVKQNKSYLYSIIAYVISVCSILRILKYRIIDDFYKRWLLKGGSFIGPATSVATTFLQLVCNALLRAYVIIALSFACIYLLIYFDSFPVAEQNKNGIEYANITSQSCPIQVSNSAIQRIKIDENGNTSLDWDKYENKAFYITNNSGNLFIDFIYFSFITMSTVGYGDILPIGIIPKIICIIQILLGYFFIGSTFALVTYVISVHGKGRRLRGRVGRRRS